MGPLCFPGSPASGIVLRAFAFGPAGSQFLTTWAWQALVPLPQFARRHAPCRCVRVSLSVPGTAPFSLAAKPCRWTKPPRGKGSVVLPWRTPSASSAAEHWPKPLPQQIGFGTPVRHPKPVFQG